MLDVTQEVQHLSNELRYKKVKVLPTSRSIAKAMKVPAHTRYSNNSACR